MHAYGKNLFRGGAAAGFSLVELLVVIAVIGVLAAIAIPQYSLYRARGFDTRAKTDLHNVATAEEAYFTDTGSYLDCDESNCTSLLPGNFGPSQGVSLQITAAPDGFTGTATHPSGTGVTCGWDSDADSADRTVDTHVKTLRAKLRAAGADPDPIRTHRGLGYAVEA